MSQGAQVVTNDKDIWVVKTAKYYENESKCVTIVHASYQRSEIIYLCGRLLECISVNAKFYASPTQGQQRDGSDIWLFFRLKN